MGISLQKMSGGRPKKKFKQSSNSEHPAVDQWS